MKHNIILTLLIAVCVLLSCSTQEQRQVRSLQRFTTELQRNSERYTDEQWQQSINEFEVITEKLKIGRYTDEERREIGKLKGQCLAIYTQYAIGSYERELKGATEELQGAFEGFMESLGTSEEK